MNIRITPLLWHSLTLHLLAAAILVRLGGTPTTPTIRVASSQPSPLDTIMIELQEVDLQNRISISAGDGAIQTGGTVGRSPGLPGTITGARVAPSAGKAGRSLPLNAARAAVGKSARRRRVRHDVWRKERSGDGPRGDRTRPRSTYGVRHKHSRTSTTVSNPALHQILRQIARARHYPQAARRQQLEGRPIVQFRITRNGQIAGATVVKTSGHTLLDTAALDTIRRAAPLPYYAEAIQIPIRFTLR